ncbi:MAG: hypothetical protein JRG74_10810 [Deltaproteobacteria bacterium]|nr:hypothetical protein [Deltaproteobacteria bacterium]
MIFISDNYINEAPNFVLWRFCLRDIWDEGYRGTLSLYFGYFQLVTAPPLSYMTSYYVIICFYKRFKQKSNAYYSKKKLKG